MLRAKEIWREKEFLLREEISDVYKKLNNDYNGRSIIVQGIIDCCFEDTKGDIYLIDYKYASGSLEKVKTEYSYQIELYKKALAKSFKCDALKIKSYIWDVNRMCEIEF